MPDIILIFMERKVCAYFQCRLGPMRVPDEVKLLIQEGEKLAPCLNTTRILRAYAGVRPLVAADGDPSGRNISRGIVLFDHEKRDGI